ncbi:hypothetical protein BBAD15_m00037 (mitochondrion) [Beauveria bassiana D1-5]|uniref:Uncharacterized protein n=1 Tax=Beauveria bassiana D1-5 TaxID=1245745 RepID=A0A0A2VN16_BEABA|nr:hypothetical protein BBAD15_m00037 [Beauveria bassiana D1-5]
MIVFTSIAKEINISSMTLSSHSALSFIFFHKLHKTYYLQDYNYNI